jgi:hypothetical protein
MTLDGNDRAGICEKCDDTCKTCSGSANTECESCFDHHSIGYTGTAGACVACHVTCKTCEGGTDDVDVCTSCYENAERDLAAWSGTCDCRAGYERKSETEDPTQTCVLKASECPAGEYKEGTECKICHSSCLACNGGEPHQCTACSFEANRVLRVYTADALFGSCECMENSYVYVDYTSGADTAIGINEVCMPCHPSCRTCWGSACESCLTCPEHSALDGWGGS